MAFDASGYNAIRGKRCAAPTGTRETNVPSQGCDRAVNNAIDFDGVNEVNDLLHLTAATAGTYVEWDLCVGEISFAAA